MKKLIIILLLASLKVSATTYYVSNSGNNTNNGTSAGTPWQTISKINSSSFSAGDVIQFNGGQTFTGTLIVPSSGAAGNAITIQSYGTGNAILTGGIEMYDIEYITIQNLTLTGSGVGSGIYASVASNGGVKKTGNKFTNLIISGFDFGILCGGDNSDGSTSGFSQMEISNNTIFNGITSGIQFYGGTYGSGFGHTNITIKNNTVYGFTGISSNPSPTGSGILLAQTTTSVIENNTVYGCNTSGNGSFGIWIYDCTAITIQYNEVYNHKSANGSDGGGFDIDGGCSNSVMQYNYSHDNYGQGYFMYSYNDGGVTTWDNNTCRYNISVNDGYGVGAHQGGVTVGASSTMTNCFVYNNTCYQSLSTSSASGFFGAAISTATGVFSNNILYSENGAKLIETIGTNPSALTITGNSYYNTGSFLLEWNGATYTTYSSWQAASAKELISAVNAGITTDPQLIAPGQTPNIGGYSPGYLISYRLKATSPIIGKGLNLNTLYGITPGPKDFFGNPIPSTFGNYDVGANQFRRYNGIW